MTVKVIPGLRRVDEMNLKYRKYSCLCFRRIDVHGNLEALI